MAVIALDQSAILGKVSAVSRPESYPRIRDLPKPEQEPFQQWLFGHTRPLLDGLPPEDTRQDAYYPRDYQRWKESKTRN